MTATVRAALVAAAASFLAASIGVAAADEEVLTQENDVLTADWVPAVTMLYVATDDAMPVFEPGAPPEFPAESPPQAEDADGQPAAGETAAEDGEAADETLLKSGPPQLTLIGAGPPVRDWKAYGRQIEADRNVSILATSLRAGKPAFWVHDASKAGYLLAYDIGTRLTLFFKVDMLREQFPSPEIPTGNARRDFIYDNVKVVLGALKVELLNSVTQQGSEGTAVETVYEDRFGGETLAEIDQAGRVEFVPRVASKAKGDLADGVYRVSLEMELEAWGALGFDEPSRRTVKAEIRFLVRGKSFEVDKIGGSSQGGSDAADPAAEGGVAGGAEAQ